MFFLFYYISYSDSNGHFYSYFLTICVNIFFILSILKCAQ